MSINQTKVDVGSTYHISGRDRLQVNAGFAMLLREEGTANLFVQLVSQEGRSIGIQKMVATLSPGQMLPLPSQQSEGLGLL